VVALQREIVDMSKGASVTHWINEIKAGAEGEAQQRIWERYFDRLVAFARSRLRGLRAFESAEDAALIAMRSFFSVASRDRFPQLDDRTELWPLLVKITAWKVADLRRRQFAGRRDVRRSISLEDVLGEEPSPEFATQLFNEGSELLESLGDESLREIARLKLARHTNADIAERMGMSVSSIERKLSLIRSQLLAEEGD
jgi:DNA-directed RNA polymerase specialized sigma24 family protein